MSKDKEWSGVYRKCKDGLAVYIGVTQLPERKNPSLVVRFGGEYVAEEYIVALFRDEENAQFFLDSLEKLCGVDGDAK
jgi:hypothetical protein